MNINRLRRTLKRRWLHYYQENRSWLVRLGVWVSCDGHRRPSSSFILATVSVLEPRLTDLFPLIVELSHDPDHVVDVLGLNFDPDQELETLHNTARTAEPPSVKMLPSSAAQEMPFAAARPPIESIQDKDNACQGTTRPRRSTLSNPRSRHRSITERPNATDT